MRKLILSIIIVVFLCTPLYAQLGGGGIYGGATGVYTNTDCNQTEYYAIGKLCQDTDDGKLYKGTGAAVVEVGAAGAIATDTIWDAAGDMVQGTGANTAGKTAIGTAGQAWIVNAGATAGEWGLPIPLVVGAGTVDAITANYTPDITLTDKRIVAFESAGANTSTTPTFAPDSLTARTIVKQGGVALVAGDIPAEHAIVLLEYNLAHTRWELLNPAFPQTTVSGNAGTATLAATSTIIDSTSATAWPLIVDTQTGNLALKTDGGLTYNATTGFLSATGFGGPINGAVGETTPAAGTFTTLTATGALNTAYTTVASHATLSAIWAAAGSIVNFTGNETITALPAAPQAGAQRILICAGTPTFTHAGAITVQGGVSYTAAAGDLIVVTATTTAAFKINIFKQSGLPVVLQTAESLHVDDILTALGIASEATHFGTFTGGTIADNVTAKAALQALETSLELKATAANYLPLAGGTMVGNLIFTDNTYDIGASGATRPRTGYFGTSVVAPVGIFSGAVTAASFSATRTTDPQALTLYEGTGGGDNFRKFTVASALTADLTFNYPNAVPTAGQVIAWSAPSSDISTGSFVLPALSSAGAQVTIATGGSTARTITIPDAPITIPAQGAATSGGPFILGLNNANPAATKEVTLDAHLSLTGTTAPALAVVTPEVNGSAHVHLTATQMTGPGVTVYNTGQTTANVFVHLPVAAAGLSGLFTVGTTQAGNHWGVCTEASVANKIYLIAADGTVAAGTDDQCVWMVAATIGQSFACWSFKTDDYDWQCKSISLAGSTFVAGAEH